LEIVAMRIQAYLRVLGDEATIRAIHRETKVSKASIKQLKARKGMTRDDTWWNWQTARTPIDIENPDDGIRVLLSRYRPIFPLIRKHSGPDTDIYLEIVTQYDENEDPHGLYLSAETVQLLSELGGALDNDVVSLMDDPAER